MLVSMQTLLSHLSYRTSYMQSYIFFFFVYTILGKKGVISLLERLEVYVHCVIPWVLTLHF